MPPAKQPVQQKTNTFALVGFICSFFVPIVGLVFSILGFNQIKKNPSEGGRGLAIAGIIISSILILISILYLIFWIILIATLSVY